ncbi:MAG: AAA family ATPase, partial [Caldilineaceae bacterium]|nr:AAA family ATPase [Caldilineaceae bacterium]
KKSNTTFAFFDALAQVKKEADSGVPNHLRDGNRDKEGFGHGEGYLYPHAYRDHWVAQQYLPTSLQGKLFYQPSDQGYEAQIRTTVAQRREAQLAAMLELESGGNTPVDVLTFSPDDPARERWLQRTISNTGERLGQVRDRLLAQARLARHSTVLDLKAGTGLLTWEALRRTPEGGVYALARTPRDAEALRQLADRLPAVERPIVLEGEIKEIATLLALREQMTQDLRPAIGDTKHPAPIASLRFDAIIGYNALFDQPDKPTLFHQLAALCRKNGVLSLAERIPRHTQRLYQLVDLSELGTELTARLIQAEEAIYRDDADPMVNWDEPDLVAWAEAAGLTVTMQSEADPSQMQISAALLQRWFAPTTGERPSYGQRLASQLQPATVSLVQQLFERQLLNQTVTWTGRIVYLHSIVA